MCYNILRKKYGLNWKSLVRIKFEKVSFQLFFSYSSLNNLNIIALLLNYVNSCHIAAKTIFPLNNVDFIFTDAYDARLNSDFLTEFVQSSTRGIILNIKPTISFLDFCKNF